MYNFRTDLALERRDIYQKANKLNQIDGVERTEEVQSYDEKGNQLGVYCACTSFYVFSDSYNSSVQLYGCSQYRDDKLILTSELYYALYD